MKKQVWKYELTVSKNTVTMPKGAEILTVQNQGGRPCIWALVYPKNESEERYFEFYGTGYDIHYDMGIERKYIGTVQFKDDFLVFHLFERIN